MKALGLWQLVVVCAVAVVAVGLMAWQIRRLQWRPSDSTAIARPGTDAESGLYGARVPQGAQVFDGFSYRVGARFAGRARAVVDRERVSFCAPRAPAGLYWLWIWLQGISLALVAPATIWALVALDWRAGLWAAALLLASTLIMAVGAGVWPGLGEVSGLGDGHYPTLEHAAADAHGVTLGAGWANGGLSWVVLPYVAGIDRLADGYAVSWWGPDERGRDVRYAFHCYDKAQADALYRALSEPSR